VPREKWYDAEAQEWFIQRARELSVLERPPEPLLLGRHLLELGLKPGPRIGEITKAVYEMQLDGRVVTLDDAKSMAKTILSTDSADYTD
jgi:tRNA nucleotidyltransferase (CCA-adding enzyme)